MSSPDTTSNVRLERRSKYFWITLILGFFALDLLIAIIAIVMAASDPSFRPMPDYSDRSVAWEVHHQERLNSERLGWTITVSAIEPDRKAIEFVVLDRTGIPVERADGTVSAYHLTRVSQQQTATIEEMEPGRYQAHIDCQRLGLWKIELHLHRKPEQTSRNSTLPNASDQEEIFVYESTTEIAGSRSD